MNAPLNQTAYYVPTVKLLKEDTSHKRIGMIIKEGDYPISQDAFFHDKDPKEVVFIMVSDVLGCNILPIDITSDIRIFVNTLIPKFKLGDIVCDLDGKRPFRIFQYTLIQGRIWYRDGWGVATNCESGRYEDKIKLYDGPSDHWAVVYNDGLMKEKQPQMYNVIMMNATTRTAKFSEHPVMKALLLQACDKFAELDMRNQDNQALLSNYLAIRAEIDYKEGKIPVMPDMHVIPDADGPGYKISFNPEAYIL